jgi:hypothetical protein
MKTITKHYKTLKQAERYQNLLYNKYDIVRLVRSPFFGEEGNYTWQVAQSPTSKGSKT